MKIINVVLLASTAFASTDYFKLVSDMDPQLKISKGKDTEITEVQLPEYPPQLTDKKRIQVLSAAIHGGQVESSTEKFAYKLYEEAKKTRKESVLYSFISNIDTKRSGSVKSERCTTIDCCMKIKDKKGKVSDNDAYKKGTMCKSFGKEPVTVCDSEKICYLNAAHVTSNNFTTDKLEVILKDRYPVSFHGYKDRNDKNGKLVHMVLGGRSNQKFKLAEAYHDWNGGVFKVAVCKDAKNCRVYDPSKSFEQRTEVDGSHITGLSTKNFVNRGKNGCGMQIELSATFRNSTLTNEAHWDSLIQFIIKTLPGNDGEICQPKD